MIASLSTLLFTRSEFISLDAHTVSEPMSPPARLTSATYRWNKTKAHLYSQQTDSVSHNNKALYRNLISILIVLLGQQCWHYWCCKQNLGAVFHKYRENEAFKKVAFDLPFLSKLKKTGQTTALACITAFYPLCERGLWDKSSIQVLSTKSRMTLTWHTVANNGHISRIPT